MVVMLVLTFAHSGLAGTKPVVETRHFLCADLVEQLGLSTVTGPEAKSNYSIEQGQLKKKEKVRV